MHKTVYLVTGNTKKVQVASHALGKFGITVEQLKIDTPEIQSTNPEEVAKYSVKYAAEIAGKLVIKGDVGFHIDSLNGFPGPFIKYINQWFTPEQFINTYKSEVNRKSHFTDALACCEPGKEPVCFVYESHGTLIDTPRGDNGVMIDSLFIPDGHKKTLAEMTHEETLEYWNNDRYAKLAAYLKNN